jgi:hypothetical protein
MLFHPPKSQRPSFPTACRSDPLYPIPMEYDGSRQAGRPDWRMVQDRPEGRQGRIRVP